MEGKYQMQMKYNKNYKLQIENKTILSNAKYRIDDEWRGKFLFLNFCAK